MPTCLKCGEALPVGAVYCSNCETPTNPQTASTTLGAQTQAASTLANASGDSDMSLRLKKALRRSEWLSYVAAGLGLAIVAFLLLIYFMPLF